MRSMNIPEQFTVDYYQSSPPLPPSPSLGASMRPYIQSPIFAKMLGEPAKVGTQGLGAADGSSAIFDGASVQNAAMVVLVGACFWQVGKAMQPPGQQYWGPIAAVAGMISPALGLGALAIYSNMSRGR